MVVIKLIGKTPNCSNCSLTSSEQDYSGGSLKKESWDKMMSTFREKKDVDLNRKLLKNQWGYLKKKYTVWATLISETGNVYDSTTNTITMSSEEWDGYVKWQLTWNRSGVPTRLGLGYSFIYSQQLKPFTMVQVHTCG